MKSKHRFFISKSLMAFLMATVILMGGCRTSGTKVLEETHENAEEARSLSIAITQEIEMKMAEEDTEPTEVSIRVDGDMEIVKDEIASMHASASIHTVIDGGDNPDSIEVYCIPGEEVNTYAVYSGVGDVWVRETIATDDLPGVQLNAQLAETVTGTDDTSLKLAETTDDEYVFTGEVSGKALQSILCVMNCVADALGLGNDPDLEGRSATVELRVSKDAKTPSSIHADLTETIAPLMEEYGEELSMLVIDIRFTGADPLDAVQVPDTITETAIDFDALLAGDYDAEDDGFDYEENYEAVESQLIDTEDTQIEMKRTTAEEPGAMDEWLSTYTLGSDSNYYQVAIRVTNVRRGDAVADEVASYLETVGESLFSNGLHEDLEYRIVDYEIYVPEDFPDETFSGVEMYVMGPEGAYLENENYEFMDMFWIEPMNTDSLYVQAGETGTGSGLFSMEKSQSEFLLEIGDYWYDEAFVRVEE